MSNQRPPRRPRPHYEDRLSSPPQFTQPMASIDEIVRAEILHRIRCPKLYGIRAETASRMLANIRAYEVQHRSEVILRPEWKHLLRRVA